MVKKRRRHTAAYKFRVALEALEVSKTNSRLSSASCVAIPTPQTRLQKSNRRSPICGKTDDA